MTKAKKITLGVVIAIVVLVLIVGSGCFYVVAENEHACVVRFSKIVDVKSEAGLYFKIPFADEVRTYPKNVQLYDIAPSTVILRDQVKMNIDSYVTWRIVDPLTFYKTMGTISVCQDRIDNLAYNNITIKFGEITKEDVVNTNPPEERNALYESIAQSVSEGASVYGIEVLDVKIKRIDLPESNENAVYERMISDRNKVAEQYRAQGEMQAQKLINEADKEHDTKISDANVESAILIAEGESEYMRIIAEAYKTDERKEFYAFIRSLDALKTSLSGGEKTIILGPDSELAKILLNP